MLGSGSRLSVFPVWPWAGSPPGIMKQDRNVAGSRLKTGTDAGTGARVLAGAADFRRQNPRFTTVQREVLDRASHGAEGAPDWVFGGMGRSGVHTAPKRMGLGRQLCGDWHGGGEGSSSPAR